MRRPAAPADIVLSPVSLGALGVLTLNDRVLKGLGPSAITGKLSDFAGLLFFPLLMLAVAELLRRHFRDDWRISRRTFIAMLVVLGLVFVGMKSVPPVAEAYRVLVGWLQRPIRWIEELATGAEASGRASLVEDPTDLVALVSLVGAFLVARHRLRVTPPTATSAGSRQNRFRRRRH